jgi:hypothetical protein
MLNIDLIYMDNVIFSWIKEFEADLISTLKIICFAAVLPV